MYSFWHTKQRSLSYFPMLIEESEVAPYLDRSAPAETCTIACAERSLLYHYMIQEWVDRLFLHLAGSDYSPLVKGLYRKCTPREHRPIGNRF